MGLSWRVLIYAICAGAIGMMTMLFFFHIMANRQALLHASTLGNQGTAKTTVGVGQQAQGAPSPMLLDTPAVKYAMRRSTHALTFGKIGSAELDCNTMPPRGQLTDWCRSEAMWARTHDAARASAYTDADMAIAASAHAWTCVSQQQIQIPASPVPSGCAHRTLRVAGATRSCLPMVIGASAGFSM